MRIQFARLGALLALLSLVFPLSAQPGGNPNPQVLPPHAAPHGHTYGEWGARWWQWALAQPAAVNPLFDTTGAYCGQGQLGPVWFLAGAFGGTFVRSCSVPAGKALFFPVVNQEWDNFVCVEPDSTLDVAGLRAFAKSVIDLTSGLAVTVDGASVQGLGTGLTTSYRVTSPVFSYTLPPANVVLALGCADAAPGTYTPIVDDGVYLMLAPLPAGPHIIRIQAENPAFGFFLDVTYNLVVGS